VNKKISSKHYGRALILLISVYCVYINVILIIIEDKGALLSTFSAMWAIILLFFITTGSVSLILSRRSVYTHKILLVLFCLYMLVNSLFYVDYYSLYFSIYIAVLIPFFILGIIYQSKNLTLLPFGLIVQPLIKILSKPKGYFLVLFISLGILGLSIWYVTTYRAYNLGQLVTIKNEYYQSLGDFYTILYISWLGYRHAIIEKASEIQGNKVKVSLIVLVLEAAFSIFFLQLFGSNKASLAVILIALFYIYYLNTGGIYKTASFIAKTALLVVTMLVISNYIDERLLNNLRLFNELNESSILHNSSITSRVEQFKNDSILQFEQGWIFGDLSIAGDYMHSSILSIQTHLGFTGTLLFWSYVLLSLYVVYFTKKDIILKSITIPILFVSTISSVYWWSPLWFLLGVLYVSDSKS
jgi:hypothetical protein